MIAEPISSRQCSANTPIQDRSNANREPVLDWQFLVNPRKSRSILCNANANSLPIEAQTDRSSVANPMPIGHQSAANPVQMASQSGENPVPIPSQSCSNLVSICFHFTLQCGYNPSPIYCLVNPWPIRYDGYSVPIRFQSEVNPRLHIIHQSISNHIPIYELNANLPIQCQSNHP